MRNSFQERLREARGSLSQAEFAHKMGLIQQTYANWENGAREPDQEKLKKLALHLGATTDWVLGLSAHRTASAADPPSEAAPPQIAITSADVSNLIATNRILTEHLARLCDDHHAQKKNRPPAHDGGGAATRTA